MANSASASIGFDRRRFRQGFRDVRRHLGAGHAALIVAGGAVGQGDGYMLAHRIGSWLDE
jgi:hypothetical protein